MQLTIHLEALVDADGLEALGGSTVASTKGTHGNMNFNKKYGQKPVEIAASKLFIREVDMVSAGVVKATGWPQRSVVVSSATSELSEDKKQTK